MPQEFLRDVLRPGDAKGRRRRLSVLPVSIAIHAIVLTIFLVSPWIVEGEMPAVDSPLKPHYLPTVPPPPPPAPPPTPTATAPKPTLPPIAAPDTIVDETTPPPADSVVGSIDTPGVNSGGSVLVGLSEPTTVVLPAPPPAPVPPKMVTIGGAIREPKKVVHVAPVYPEIARLSRLEGKVTMEAILDATGRVESVRVIGATPLFEDAAVRAVKQWRYSPTQLNGVPVPVLMTITVVFTLQR
jgi:protein TonB